MRTKPSKRCLNYAVSSVVFLARGFRHTALAKKKKSSKSRRDGHGMRAEVHVTVDARVAHPPICQLLVCGARALDGYETLNDAGSRVQTCSVDWNLPRLALSCGVVVCH